MSRKQLEIACLFALVLLPAVFIPISSQVGTYDPWVDINDDGKIDGKDIAFVAKGFGTSGTPITKAAVEYDSGWINISDKQGQYFNITPGFNLENSTWMPNIYGKVTATSPMHQKYWYGYDLPGWNKTYGGNGSDYAYSVIETSDKGYAIAGYTNSTTAGVWDFMLIKADSSGEIQWNQTYGGTNDDRASSLVQTVDGGYAIAGYTTSYGAGYNDFWLVKTDASGNMQWNRTYGGAQADYACSVIQTSDSGLALAGYTHSYDAGGGDSWLVKIDATGEIMWNRTYGGTNHEWTWSLIQTFDGGYALAGETYSYGAGNSDFWLVKTDANGNMQWNQTYGGIIADFAFSLLQTPDTGYVLAGMTGSYGAGSDDAWLIKTDSAGNAVWNRTYGGPSYDYAWSLVQTFDGGFALAGSTYSYDAGSDFWLVKTDASGNMQWNRTYGGPNADYAYHLVQTSDGGYAIAGYTTALFYADVYLVKTDAFGLMELELGVTVANITADTLTFYRGTMDPYYNYIRVRIWIVKQNP